MSQAKLADILNVSRQSVSAWLKGESEPTVSKICILMEFFNCQFEDLIE